MKIRLDKADKAFSLYIRLRDGKCVRCGRRGEEDKDGNPIIGLQCSHYFGRANENTRFNEANCDSLCFGCHEFWGSRNHEDYRKFKIKQLGEKGFDDLVIQAYLHKKKDRKLSYVIAKELLKKIKAN